jgi:hypothetical protein
MADTRVISSVTNQLTYDKLLNCSTSFCDGLQAGERTKTQRLRERETDRQTNKKERQIDKQRNRERERQRDR